MNNKRTRNLYRIEKEYDSVIKTKKALLELAQQELSKEENNKRIRIVYSKLRELHKKGRLKELPKSEGGAFLVRQNNRVYYIYPNFVAEIREGDNTLRILYLVGENRDTIKLAIEKLNYIGLLKVPIVKLVVDSMNLQGKVK